MELCGGSLNKADDVGVSFLVFLGLMSPVLLGLCFLFLSQCFVVMKDQLSPNESQSF